ncbi:MAG: isoprenyl synthetase [Bacteroidota bacterium]|nr:isoprenyl synthetase [Bacteroidota bacterium]
MHSIEELRETFAKYLNDQSFTQEPKNLYEPNNYFLQIGGKRLRPTLLLLSTELFDGKIEEALPAALAVEYFHNFTLIHDDVMDKAPSRRGYKTMHEKYNLNTAILSGDVLLVKAFECIGKTHGDFRKLFAVFTKTAIEVCEGQQYDIEFETTENVTQEEYIEMIRLKSAVLLAGSMKIGAIIGDASEENANLLYAYGENLGIAFQIQDDILDCYGDESLVGKLPGGDIIQNKKTLLLIEALNKDDGQLKEWISKKEFDQKEKLQAVLNIYDQYHIKEYALEQRSAYVQKSEQLLNQINLPGNKKTILKDLVNYLVIRDF